MIAQNKTQKIGRETAPKSVYTVFIYAITVVIKSAYAAGILFSSQEQCTETRPLSENVQNLIQVINLRLLIIDGLYALLFSPATVGLLISI